VEKEMKATHSGNTRIHGMTQVTPASIAYIVTQVSSNLHSIQLVLNAIRLWQTQFALSSSSVFSRTNTTTDSERFCNSILELFDDVEEREEVEDLIIWWNQYDLHVAKVTCAQSDVSV
jgi:hypothetical protein